MPQRPIQHQLEDESRTAFAAILPSRHVFRSEHRDYGIDCEVEEFDQNNAATGRRFRVQIKATGETGSAAMRERIKLDSAAYYRAQQLPVLMVRYVAPTKRLYGRWFHEFDPYYEHVGETHLTFHWTGENELSEASFDALFSEVERMTRLRSARLSLPLNVDFNLPGEGAHGMTRTELELALEARVARCPGVLRRANDGDVVEVTISVAQAEVGADISGLTSATFHFDDGAYPSDTPQHTLAADALSCVAIALARVGHGEPAARIAMQHFPGSLISTIPELGVELVAAMVEAGRVVEVIEIAERLDQDPEEDRETSGGVFMEVVRMSTESLQPHEHQRFEAALGARLDRRMATERTGLAAASAENVGTYLMSVRRPSEAIEFLELAVELDPTRETPDMAERLAGAFFLSGRYADSVPAYDRALELAEGADPRLEARRADALMYAGRYRRALDAFRQIETDDVELGAWIYVKVRALEWVMEVTGIDEQDRDPKAAEEMAGRWSEIAPDEMDELADRVWDRDAVSSLGWFNRARDLYDRGLERDAMHAYLTAAVMREGDVEAWVNVALLAGNVGDADLFATGVITGNRLNEGPYLDQFVRHLRLTLPESEVREEMLTLVRRTIESAKSGSPAQPSAVA
jgi:tetratricopeptide (TPR) repeat protein